ncbi:MAG TPA: hypothetical protein VGF65_02990 [Mycobacterium sp.]|jgi:hypothetical protein
MPAKTVRPRPRAARAVKSYPVREDGITPLRLTTTPDAEREPVERVPLFSIDGREYTIPSRLPFTLGLRIMRTSRKEGVDAALIEMLEEALDEDAFAALLAYRDLQPQHLWELFQAIQKVVMGAVETPKDGSRSA